MKRIAWFLLVVFCMGALSVAAGRTDASPMVERHLFTPEPESNDSLKGPEKSPQLEKLEKELSFTGIIKSSRGNWAFIHDKKSGGKKDRESIKRYKEGDEIRGLLVREIGSNYVVLGDEGSEMRLDLFRGEKSRPAPPPEPVENTAAPAANQEKPAAAGSVSKTQKSAAGKSQKSVRPPARPGSKGNARPAKVSPSQKSPAANPFAEALKKAREQRQSGGAPASNSSNPFAEALRKARGY